MQSTSNLTLSEENIRFRAYLLWEADGRQEGRDHHYWTEALAQLQDESRAPLEEAAAKVSKASRAKKVSLKEDDGVAAKSVKKPKATSAGKGGAADSGYEAKVKQNKKASTKSGGKVAEKSMVVAEPKSAKKTKTGDVAGSASESTPDTAPARAKKSREVVADETQSASP